MNTLGKSLTLLAAFCFTNGMLRATPAESSAFDDPGIITRYWIANVNGSIAETETSSSKLSIEDHLGIKKENLLAIDLTFNRAKWDFQFENYNLEENTRLGNSFTFHSVDFKPGDELRSELDIKRFRLRFLPGYESTGNSNFTWLAELNRSDVKTKLEAGGLSPKATQQSFQKYSAGLGVRFETNRLQRTSWYIDIVGLPGESYFFDAEIGLTYRIPDKTTIAVGYRSYTQKIAAAEDDIRFTLSGPFMEMKYLF